MRVHGCSLGTPAAKPTGHVGSILQNPRPKDAKTTEETTPQVVLLMDLMSHSSKAPAHSITCIAQNASRAPPSTSVPQGMDTTNSSFPPTTQKSTLCSHIDTERLASLFSAKGCLPRYHWPRYLQARGLCWVSTLAALREQRPPARATTAPRRSGHLPPGEALCSLNSSCQSQSCSQWPLLPTAALAHGGAPGLADL